MPTYYGWDAAPTTYYEDNFDPATLFTANGGPAGGVGLFYDPSDKSSMFQDVAGTVPITASGQSVARLNDKSGGGRHMTQSDSGKRPVYTESGGKAFLVFTNDYLTQADSAMGNMSNSSVDIFVRAGEISSQEQNVYYEGSPGDWDTFRPDGLGLWFTSVSGANQMVYKGLASSLNTMVDGARPTAMTNFMGRKTGNSGSIYVSDVLIHTVSCNAGGTVNGDCKARLGTAQSPGGTLDPVNNTRVGTFLRITRNLSPDERARLNVFATQKN